MGYPEDARQVHFWKQNDSLPRKLLELYPGIREKNAEYIYALSEPKLQDETGESDAIQINKTSSNTKPPKSSEARLVLLHYSKNTSGSTWKPGQITKAGSKVYASTSVCWHWRAEYAKDYVVYVIQLQTLSAKDICVIRPSLAYAEWGLLKTPYLQPSVVATLPALRVWKTETLQISLGREPKTLWVIYLCDDVDDN